MIESLANTDWTNESVLKLAGGHDPVKYVLDLISDIILKAMDDGWEGPPYDPVDLAKHIGISVVPNANIPDARAYAGPNGKPTIEFNPNRAATRVRFNVAHEIAHTIFPDYAERVRLRDHHRRESVEPDTWQLETLCNLAAAEILMPQGALPELHEGGLTIEGVIELKEKFQVSVEAVLIRIVNQVDFPLIAFAASTRRDRDGARKYGVDYSVSQPKYAGFFRKDTLFSTESVVRRCTAIGFTAKGNEYSINSETPIWVECVGLPPVPGENVPRVAGFAVLNHGNGEPPKLTYVIQEALSLVERERSLLVHIINDKTPNWGGGGLAASIKGRWPTLSQNFIESVRSGHFALVLAETYFDDLPGGSRIGHMIAQRGYGQSRKPRIRYHALNRCLRSVAQEAERQDLPVVMPRIGVGNAGGDWNVIEDLVKENLCNAGIPVTVCDLPGSSTRTQPPSPSQKPLFD